MVSDLKKTANSLEQNQQYQPPPNGSISSYADGFNFEEGSRKVIGVKDIIGQSLSQITTHKQLDRTKQVVALINDVR